MITAYGTVENAVSAMQSGATNFIQKPWDNEKLLADVRAAVARQKAEEENIQLKRALKQRYNFENIVGKSEPMLKIFDLVAQVAPSRSTVLLQGESGTGKELIAKAIHLNSTRRDRPFVPVNSGSTPPDLLESTLFGHVKGAFTSAIASKKGLFEVADRGTLFLDEIGTMSMDTQSKDSARAAGPQVHAPGRRAGNSGGRAHHRRHQRRSAADGAGRQVPRRPVLSAERDHASTCRRCGSAAKIFRCWSNTSSRSIPRKTSGPGAASPRGVASAGELLVAGQRPRTGKHDRARRRAVVRQRRLESICCPTTSSAGAARFRALEASAGATLFSIMEDCERRIIIDMLEKCGWNQTEAAERFHVPLSTLNQKIKTAGDRDQEEESSG